MYNIMILCLLKTYKPHSSHSYSLGNAITNRHACYTPIINLKRRLTEVLLRQNKPMKRQRHHQRLHANYNCFHVNWWANECIAWYMIEILRVSLDVWIADAYQSNNHGTFLRNVGPWNTTKCHNSFLYDFITSSAKNRKQVNFMP